MRRRLKIGWARWAFCDAEKKKTGGGSACVCCRCRAASLLCLWAARQDVFRTTRCVTKTEVRGYRVCKGTRRDGRNGNVCGGDADGRPVADPRRHVRRRPRSISAVGDLAARVDTIHLNQYDFSHAAPLARLQHRLSPRSAPPSHTCTAIPSRFATLDDVTCRATRDRRPRPRQ